MFVFIYLFMLYSNRWARLFIILLHSIVVYISDLSNKKYLEFSLFIYSNGQDSDDFIQIDGLDCIILYYLFI